MRTRLENDFLCAEIESKGAQLRSLRFKQRGEELIWQADPAIWKDSAPWLFPLIGQLKGGTYRAMGETYALPMHGFAGDAEFSLVQQDAVRATFILSDSAQTLRVFPWRFSFRVTFQLDGKRLRVTAETENCDTTEMYFSVGAHPGFLCERGDTLSLNNASPVPVYRLNTENHLLCMEERETLPAQATLVLTEDLFDEDAMLLRGGDISALCLCKKAGEALRITCDRTPWLGLWSRKRAGLSYLCIEPWYGVDDPEQADGAIEKKQDIQCLRPGETMSLCYSVARLTDEEGE